MDLTHSTLTLACSVAQIVVELPMWSSSTQGSRTAVATSSRVIETLVLLLEDRTVFTSASLALPLMCRCLIARATEADNTSPEYSLLDGFIHRGILAIPADSIPAVFATQLADVLAHQSWGENHASLRVSCHQVAVDDSLIWQMIECDHCLPRQIFKFASNCRCF